MPRPRNNSLLALFKCNESDQIVCYNEKCDGKILYKHSANLERHLKLLHPMVYSSYIKKKKILKYPRKLNFEKRLIDLVREYPILWCKSNENRFNEDLKHKAWKEISFKMEVTVRTCLLRWESLMDKFKTELNQSQNQSSLLSNGDTSKIPSSDSKSTWKYFSELLFLRDHIDLTSTYASSKSIEQMRQDYVKEESIESYNLYNETLEETSQFEYGSESFIQDDVEKCKLSDKKNETTLDDEKNPCGSLYNDESFGQINDRIEELNPVHDTQNDYTNQTHEKSIHFDESDDNDDDGPQYRKKIKQKTLKLKTDGLANELDPDRMFLLSLWPFLNNIPDDRKLLVRQKIQGVLLEEQNKK